VVGVPTTENYVDRLCSVPVNILQNIPYSIADGECVHATVICRNKMGNSPVSLVGNGACLARVPGAPLNVQCGSQ
jgi:hypothetical protein